MTQITERRVFQGVFVASFVLAMIPIMLFLWWKRPISTFRITKPLAVIEDEVEVGTEITYRLNYCQPADINGEAHYSFIDSVIYQVPGGMARDLPAGCNEITEGLVVPNIPPGIYRLEMVRVYEPTPFQRIEVRVLSNRFRVVRGAAPIPMRDPQ
jgi:hypothetical protein